MREILAEICSSNDNFLSTEIEEDDKDYRFRGFKILFGLRGTEK